jgi:2-C-methyl-D-erythritol 4-phosphate cytidylyltransferase
MFLWSVEALSRVDEVGEILVAAPPDELDTIKAICQEAKIPRWRCAFPGGRSRRESVAALLKEAKGDRVLVHDAARPCISPGWVSGLIAELGSHRVGVPALPVRDTLKRGNGGVVRDTVPRDGIYAVQTPQIFETDLLRGAHAHGIPGGGDVTDDASLVESVGGKVWLLKGDPSNIKVTFPEDVDVAERLLAGRTK